MDQIIGNTITVLARATRQYLADRPDLAGRNREALLPRVWAFGEVTAGQLGAPFEEQLPVTRGGGLSDRSGKAPAYFSFLLLAFERINNLGWRGRSSKTGLKSKMFSNWRSGCVRIRCAAAHTPIHGVGADGRRPAGLAPTANPLPCRESSMWTPLMRSIREGGPGPGRPLKLGNLGRTGLVDQL